MTTSITPMRIAIGTKDSTPWVLPVNTFKSSKPGIKQDILKNPVAIMPMTPRAIKK